MTELNFKGKEFVYNHHLSVPYRPLVMHSEKGIGEPSLDSNLIVHGDNLHALKALLPLYAGKVDCIFIDPPYNTGNEGWCYNDNVNAPMIKEWLESSPIGVEDGLRHDKWCTMMWPRLSLLHELLSVNGSLWVTLDDNEVHRARNILDEIFGENSFVGQIAWQKERPERIELYYPQAMITFSYIPNHFVTRGSSTAISWRQVNLDIPIQIMIREARGHQFRFRPKGIERIRFIGSLLQLVLCISLPRVVVGERQNPSLNGSKLKNEFIGRKEAMAGQE